MAKEEKWSTALSEQSYRWDSIKPTKNKSSFDLFSFPVYLWLFFVFQSSAQSWCHPSFIHSSSSASLSLFFFSLKETNYKSKRRRPGLSCCTCSQSIQTALEAEQSQHGAQTTNFCWRRWDKDAQAVSASALCSAAVVFSLPHPSPQKK